MGLRELPLRWRISLAMLLVVFVLLFVTTIFFGDTAAAPTLTAGVCYDVGESQSISNAVVKDCNEPHTGEMFGVFTAAEFGDFDADRDCGQLADLIVDPQLLPASASFEIVPPSRAQWDAGENVVVCAAVFAEPVAESIRLR